MPDEKQSYSLLSFQVSDSLSALVLHYHIEGDMRINRSWFSRRIQLRNLIS